MSELEQVTLTINEQVVAAPKGALLIDVATNLGIEIPVFCSHPKLDPVACCRQCLVEFEGPRGTMLNTACNAPVMNGMVVRTNTDAVKAAQEANLAFILLHHPLDCPICDKGGECPLQDMTMRFGPGVSQLAEPKRTANKNYAISNTIVLDQERCVICWRCVRYLEEWEEKPQLGLFERGGDTVIDVQPGQCVDAKTSGNIIDICPVGALTNHTSRFQYRPWQVQRTATISLHDPMGNNISVDTRNDTEVRRILGRENMAVNDQFITDKDRFCFHWTRHPDRLTKPLVRRDVGQPLREATWDEALALVAEKLQTAQPNSTGLIGSAKLSNESNYLLQRLAREVIKTNNIDHRQGGDVQTGVTGLPDLTHLMQPQNGPKPAAEVVFLFGLDPSEEIPMLDVHLKRAVSRGGLRLFVAHPRQIESAFRAEASVQYLPGDELALVQTIAQHVLSSHPTPNEDYADWQNAEVSLASSTVEKAQLIALALAQCEHAVILCGPDPGHQSTGKELREGLRHLADLTGHSKGLSFIGLDANSQGCRDMGVMPTCLPGGHELRDNIARARLSALWDAQIPTETGQTYVSMLECAGSSLQTLYIMGADPAAENDRWAQNLESLDFLVVQELFMTCTAEKAHVVLPAVSWVETDGTFTNLDRRVQRGPKAIGNPDSAAAPDWNILDHVAARMGHEWNYRSVRDITRELGQAIPTYEGITWENLGDSGRRRQLNTVPPLALDLPIWASTPPPNQNSLRLYRGRIFYDAGRMCALTPEVNRMVPEDFLAVHPQDLTDHGLAEGTEVIVTSSYGSVTVPVKADATVTSGSVWLPESLKETAVGTLLNGNYWEWVTLSRA
jgi:NADH-quinone oxidoreductase subunit G